MRSDKELLQLACSMMANWMETGNPILSKNDVIESKQERKVKLRSLDTDQLKDVLRLRELAEDPRI